MLTAYDSVTHAAARALAISAKVEDAIKHICHENGCTCFTDQQIERLQAIAVHLILINDRKLDGPQGLARLSLEFKKLSLLNKAITIATLIPLFAIFVKGIEITIRYLSDLIPWLLNFMSGS